MTATRAPKHPAREAEIVQCPQCGTSLRRGGLTRHQRDTCGKGRARHNARPPSDLDTRIAALVAVCRQTRDPALLRAYRLGLMRLVHERVRGRG